MVTLVHTGGSSIPGSSGIWADHLDHMQPDVSFHTNGGPVAMPDEDFPRLVERIDHGAADLHSGQSAHGAAAGRSGDQGESFERLLIATDTPTGSGIMPLGMFYTISHLASLGGRAGDARDRRRDRQQCAVYRLNSGLIAPGRDADLVVIDAAAGGSKGDALSALTNGDIPAIGAVITDGVPRFVGRSRNTPATIRTIRVVQNRLPREFGEGAH